MVEYMEVGYLFFSSRMYPSRHVMQTCALDGHEYDILKMLFIFCVLELLLMLTIFAGMSSAEPPISTRTTRILTNAGHVFFRRIGVRFDKCHGGGFPQFGFGDAFLAG